MNDRRIRKAQPNEMNKITALMTVAFCNDPFARWIYPGPEMYLAHFPQYFKIFSEEAFSQDTAFVAEPFAGVAMWLPPGTDFDERALGQHFTETVPPERLAEMGALLTEMEEQTPEEDVWYLPMIGVDTKFQGQGVGNFLMQSVLAQTDQIKIATHLESSNPANVPFYNRLGYEIVSEIKTSKTAPLMTVMHRSPRST